ncbi:hypothetical protein L345_08274, partial [Ophiophagus hannah]
ESGLRVGGLRRPGVPELGVVVEGILSRLRRTREQASAARQLRLSRRPSALRVVSARLAWLPSPLRTVSIASAAALPCPSPPSLPPPSTLRHCLFVLENENKMSLEPPERWRADGGGKKVGKNPASLPECSMNICQLNN